jgi:hypothetical protein
LQPATGQRLGLIGAAKAAYRPVHYREDLRLAVPLITRTHAVWPVLALTIVAVPLSLSRPPIDSDPVLGVTTFFLSPMMLMPGIMAGLLAPRATWLAGVINGLIVGTGLTLLIVVGAGRVVGYDKVASDQVIALFIQIVSLSVPMGAVVAAFTGWYKRFLTLSSGPGNRRKAK